MQCGIKFRAKHNKVKLCSVACKNQYITGKPLILTDEQHQNRSNGKSGQNNPMWGKDSYWKNREITKDHRDKMIEGIKKSFTPARLSIMREMVLGDKNPYWKGDDVGYAGLHTWLNITYGKADRCENKKCLKISQTFHLAKLRGKNYERKRENFIMLCVSCHNRYDKNPKFNIEL